MLKISRISVVFLVAGLSLGMVLFSGQTSFGSATGGVARDYDDSYGVSHRVMSRPYLDIEVWVSKGEGATYYPGDDIKVYFRASRDCYVVLYNIDTRGYVHLLYPVDQWDDPYAEGGRVYRIPDRFDDYELTVSGPDGVEYIQAVASLEPLDLPNFPGEYTYEGEVYAYCLDGEDPFDFMAAVNAEIAPYDYASDVCMFSVEYAHPKWYYWPRVVYVDRPVDILWGGVYFDYPWGVEVWIDGMFYGITPITIPALVVGRHYVSFWHHGCWIWRDWFHVRRGCVIDIWPDCRDRYRYVHERFVEKSYRAEKAKRRRGIGKTAGLVKPVRMVEKGRLVKAETSRIKEEREIRREGVTNRRGLKDHPAPLRLSERKEARKVERIIRRPEAKSSPSQRPTSIDKGKAKAKEIKLKGRTPKKIKSDGKLNRRKQPSKVTQKVRGDDRSKAKASTMKKGTVKRGASKPSSPSKTQVKETRSSKQGKKRR
jgi:hypothetical protein